MEPGRGIPLPRLGTQGGDEPQREQRCIFQAHPTGTSSLSRFSVQSLRPRAPSHPPPPSTSSDSPWPRRPSGPSTLRTPAWPRQGLPCIRSSLPVVQHTAVGMEKSIRVTRLRGPTGSSCPPQLLVPTPGLCPHLPQVGQLLHHQLLHLVGRQVLLLPLHRVAVELVDDGLNGPLHVGELLAVLRGGERG